MRDQRQEKDTRRTKDGDTAALRFPTDVIDHAARAFLNEARDIFESLDRRSLKLTRQELIDALQNYLPPLEGRSFGVGHLRTRGA
jgi:hypothetical protein